MRHGLRWFVPLAVVALGLSGCGSSTPTGPVGEAVSGEVTFSGAPLATGRIVFLPETPVDAADYTAQIVDGKYDFPAASGPIAGKYKVALYAGTNEIPSAAMIDGMPGETPKVKRKPQPIPAKYNTQTAQTADVEAGKPNVLNFNAEK